MQLRSKLAMNKVKRCQCKERGTIGCNKSALINNLGALRNGKKKDLNFFVKGNFEKKKKLVCCTRDGHIQLIKEEISLLY